MPQAASLPEGAKALEWFEEGGASCGLCDIGGTCWLYSLESDGSDPTAVLKLIRRTHTFAKDAGYESMFAQTMSQDILNLAHSIGWAMQSVIIEKAL